MKTLTNVRRAPLALMVGAVIALAACGSSSGSSNTAHITAGTGTTPSATGTGKALVTTANLPKVGAVLVDPSGRTLYTLKNGTKPVPCTGACTSVWPPLMSPAGTAVVVAGAPLYRFAGDQAPGDTKGDGISSFGGVWHVVKASPSAAVAAPGTTLAPAPTTPTTPTTMYSSGGY